MATKKRIAQSKRGTKLATRTREKGAKPIPFVPVDDDIRCAAERAGITPSEARVLAVTGMVADDGLVEREIDDVLDAAIRRGRTVTDLGRMARHLKNDELAKVFEDEAGPQPWVVPPDDLLAYGDDVRVAIGSLLDLLTTVESLSNEETSDIIVEALKKLRPAQTWLENEGRRAKEAQEARGAS